MPCRYDDETEADDLRKRLDEATRLLCYLCGELQADGLWTKYAGCRDLSCWRKRHHDGDQERVAAKMAAYLRDEPVTSPRELALMFIATAKAVHPVSRWHVKWFRKMAEEACRAAKRDESIFRKALAKLSKDERDALGLDACLLEGRLERHQRNLREFKGRKKYPPKGRKKYPMPEWAVSQAVRESGLVENVCEHGVGHPSPEWLEEHPDKKNLSIHGCDGCCRARTPVLSRPARNARRRRR